LLRGLVRAWPARLQRPLRHPGTMRQLPGQPGRPVQQRASPSGLLSCPGWAASSRATTRLASAWPP